MWLSAGPKSPDQLDLARAPSPVEEWLERAAEAQDHEPAFARHRLDPVAPLDAVELLRAEVDRRGAFGVRLGDGRRIALAARAGSVAAWVISVWNSMGIIFYDTAISVTPLHLTETDDDPSWFSDS